MNACYLHCIVCARRSCFERSRPLVESELPCVRDLDSWWSVSRWLCQACRSIPNSSQEVAFPLQRLPFALQVPDRPRYAPTTMPALVHRLHRTRPGCLIKMKQLNSRKSPVLFQTPSALAAVTRKGWTRFEVGVKGHAPIFRFHPVFVVAFQPVAKRTFAAR